MLWMSDGMPFLPPRPTDIIYPTLGHSGRFESILNCLKNQDASRADTSGIPSCSSHFPSIRKQDDNQLIPRDAATHDAKPVLQLVVAQCAQR